MRNFYIMFFAVSMKGIVDQIDAGKVYAELIAKDGHTHQTEIPQWLFPCQVKEGTEFWINTRKNSVNIKCEN